MFTKLHLKTWVFDENEKHGFDYKFFDDVRYFTASENFFSPSF